MACFDVDSDMDGMEKEYKLYVSNLPLEMNENAIRDIFNQYGEITGLFHAKRTTWAFITYKSFCEAELAIRELNNKKPLYLKVSVAQEKKSPMKEMQNLSVATSFEKSKMIIPDSLPACNDTKLGVVTVTSDGKRHVSLGRGYTLYEFPEPCPKIEEYVSKVYEQRNNGLYEYSEDKLKNSVQRCSICSTKTTKHCEKCHTYYCSKACQLEDWPQHQAECERIPALVDETVNSISSLYINQDISQTKKSSLTNNKTIKSNDMKLRRPNTINAMQSENLNNMNANNNMHKNDTDVSCHSTKSVNSISQEKYSSGQYDGSNIFQTKVTEQSIRTTKEFPQQRRLHKYYMDESIDQLRNSSNFTVQNRYNHQNDSDKTSHNKEKCDSSSVRDRHDRNNFSQKTDSQSNASSACYNVEKINKQGTNAYNNSLNNNIDFYKDMQLSKTKFIPVKIATSLGNGEYWVSKLEDEDVYTTLMMELQIVAAKSHNVQPIIDEIYGVRYEDIWYRALVTSLNPVKVHLIDYGNDKILKKGDEIKDIGNLVKAPSYARKVRVAQDTDEKYKNLQINKTIYVRMLSIDSEKTMIVEVQEQFENPSVLPSEPNNVTKKLVPQENSQMSPNKDTKVSTIQVSDIFDTFANLLTQKTNSELQIDGYIQIEYVQNNIYSAMLSPAIYDTEIDMLLNILQDECSKAEAVQDYRPKPEELICGKCSDGWYRGYIYSEEPSLSIISIDEAKIQKVEKILPCPQKYWDICAFGVICEINQPAKIEVGQAYDFKTVVNMKNCKQKVLEISIGPEKIQAIVRPWKSIINSKNTAAVVSELKNGSKICLTSYRNQYCMFARSLDEDQVEYYNNVMQTVTRYAQTAPHLTEPPHHQDIVIAPFEDGNSYRAMVLKTENDKAKIVYIDFGNVDEVYIKDLKVMPQCEELQQSCAAKIILKGVPHNIPSNPEVDLYIRNLLGKEVPLVCTYEGTSPKNGVCLTMLTGECINDKINELLISDWKKENNDTRNKCYMLQDIEFAKLGNIGETVNAVVLYIRNDNQTTYMMSPYDIDLTTHIFDVMPKMLTEYCEKTEYYIPRKHELCLALYEEIWYRAVCLNPKESYTTSEILFIDYGNIETVKHKHIRLMPKDFVVPAALASICTVVNLAPIDSDGRYAEAVQKKIEELVVINSPVKIKIVECIEDGDYKVELPDVRNELIKHGLVK